MNPCFNCTDFGRDYAHKGTIFPFRDRPDVAVEVLWFPRSLDSPYVPSPNPFVLRNWDRLEQLSQTVIGTNQTDNRKWTGPLPINPPGVPCGTADEWANGLLYSRWIANGYTCSCPEVIYMDFVSSIHNIDGSFIFAPNIGDVEGHVNTSHVNHWLVEQYFVSSSPLLPAATFQPAPGANITCWRALDEAGRTRSEWRSTNAGVNYSLRIFDVGGTLRVNLRDAGSVLFTDGAGGHNIQLSALGPNSWQTTGDFTVLTTGVARWGCNLMVGPQVTAVFPTGAGAALTAVDDTASGHFVFQAGTVLGGVFSTYFNVEHGDNVGTPAQVNIIGRPSNFEPVIESVRTVKQVGIRFRHQGGSGPFGDAIQVQDDVGQLRFCVGADGQLLTHNTAPATVADFVIRRLEVFDTDGTSLGFIPIFNSIL